MENNPGYHKLLDLLAAFNQGTEAVLKLFTPQALVEYPYAGTLGLPCRLTMEDYRKHLDTILASMPEISFTDVKVHALEEKNGYWGEFRAATVVPQTQSVYQQDYVVNFELQDGKFSFYKEFWNVLPVLQHLMDKDAAHYIIDNPVKP